MRWHQWVLVGLGLWLTLAPWILGFSDLNLATWDSVMVGGLVIVFALWNLSPPMVP